MAAHGILSRLSAASAQEARRSTSSSRSSTTCARCSTRAPASRPRRRTSAWSTSPTSCTTSPRRSRRSSADPHDAPPVRAADEERRRPARVATTSRRWCSVPDHRAARPGRTAGATRFASDQLRAGGHMSVGSGGREIARRGACRFLFTKRGGSVPCVQYPTPRASQPRPPRPQHRLRRVAPGRLAQYSATAAAHGRVPARPRGRATRPRRDPPRQRRHASTVESIVTLADF